MPKITLSYILVSECITDDAHQRTFVACKGMVATGIDLFLSPELLKQAHADWFKVHGAASQTSKA
jgi:hypothetical protein